MFKTKNIEKLLSLALLTGFVENDVPTSVLLISPPEHAKTSIIRGIKCQNCLETSDLSPKTIVDKLIPRVLSEKIHHLIVPDLVKPLSHKAVTVDATVAFLNAVIEEGVQNQMFFGQELSLSEPVKFGLITSVTPDYFVRFFKKWNDIGFLTRFVIVSYNYSPVTVAEIHDLIRRNELATLYFGSVNITKNMKKKFKDGALKVKVKIPEDEALFLSNQAQQIATRMNTFKVPVYSQGGHISYIKPECLGFRLQRQLRMLASASAISNNRDVVNFVDVGELLKLIDFIGFPNTSVVL